MLFSSTSITSSASAPYLSHQYSMLNMVPSNHPTNSNNSNHSTTSSSTSAMVGQIPHFKSSSIISPSSSNVLQTHLSIANNGLPGVNHPAAATASITEATTENSQQQLPPPSAHSLNQSNDSFLIVNDPNRLELSTTTTNTATTTSSKTNDRSESVHQINATTSSVSSSNEVRNVMLYGIPIVSLLMDGQERLCLAQISNTLLKNFSYNEIHNRRVALGITCVQCTPVQLELLRRAGAMPVSSRRCGMITKREAERLCKSFLAETEPPKLPESFSFDVYHSCAWGCRGSFTPSRYNSSRAKCIKCNYCGLFFSPNKFIFHSHRLPSSKYVQPDAANFNSWRRHIKLVGSPEPADHVIFAWEDVKAMFNGGSRKRAMTSTLNSFTKNQEQQHSNSNNGNPNTTLNHHRLTSTTTSKNGRHNSSSVRSSSATNHEKSTPTTFSDDNNNSGLDEEDSDEYQYVKQCRRLDVMASHYVNELPSSSSSRITAEMNYEPTTDNLSSSSTFFVGQHQNSKTNKFEGNCFRKAFETVSNTTVVPSTALTTIVSAMTTTATTTTSHKCFSGNNQHQSSLSSPSLSSPSLSSSAASPQPPAPSKSSIELGGGENFKSSDILNRSEQSIAHESLDSFRDKMNPHYHRSTPQQQTNSADPNMTPHDYSMFGSRFPGLVRHNSGLVSDLMAAVHPNHSSMAATHPAILSSLLANTTSSGSGSIPVPAAEAPITGLSSSNYGSPTSSLANHFNHNQQQSQQPTISSLISHAADFPHNLAEFMWSMASKAAASSAASTNPCLQYGNFLWPTPPPQPPLPPPPAPVSLPGNIPHHSIGVRTSLMAGRSASTSPNDIASHGNVPSTGNCMESQTPEDLRKAIFLHQQHMPSATGHFPPFLPSFIGNNLRFLPPSNATSGQQQQTYNLFIGNRPGIENQSETEFINNGNRSTIKQQSVKSLSHETPKFNASENLFSFRSSTTATTTPPLLQPPPSSQQSSASMERFNNEMMAARNQLIFDAYQNLSISAATAAAVAANSSSSSNISPGNNLLSLQQPLTRPSIFNPFLSDTLSSTSAKNSSSYIDELKTLDESKTFDENARNKYIPIGGQHFQDNTRNSFPQNESIISQHQKSHPQLASYCFGRGGAAAGSGGRKNCNVNPNQAPQSSHNTTANGLKNIRNNIPSQNNTLKREMKVKKKKQHQVGRISTKRTKSSIKSNHEQSMLFEDLRKSPNKIDLPPQQPEDLRTFHQERPSFAEMETVDVECDDYEPLKLSVIQNSGTHTMAQKESLEEKKNEIEADRAAQNENAYDLSILSDQHGQSSIIDVVDDTVSNPGGNLNSLAESFSEPKKNRDEDHSTLINVVDNLNNQE